MSTQYNNEPNPTAKVLLHTTAGEVEIELFAKQTPLTSRNFLQHCLDGYYDNTIFHRLVPKFVIQGGDPTGTGSGGASIYQDGAPFKDETHSRLKFNRRGLLGMANTGKKDENQCQFFFTLDATPELTGKNTMFGRIVGDTWYNVLKMADQAESSGLVEGTDRPLFPPKITSSEILLNFFDDMVKRDLQPKIAPAEKKEQKAKPKRKATAALLSFGDEDGLQVAPIKKKQRANPKLDYMDDQSKAPASNGNGSSGSKQKTETSVPQPAPQRSSSPPADNKRPKANTGSKRQQSPVSDDSDSNDSDVEQPSKAEDVIAKTSRQIEELKASMRRNGPATSTHEPRNKTALEAMIPATSTKGRKRGAALSTAEEQRTADLLAAFKLRLDNAPENNSQPLETPSNDKAAPHGASEDEEDAEEKLCDLHFVLNCQSCSKWDQDDTAQDDADVEEGWMGHKLNFEKDRLGKDLEWKRKNEEDLVVIDPRAKEVELGLKSKGNRGEKGRQR